MTFPYFHGWSPTHPLNFLHFMYSSTCQDLVQTSEQDDVHLKGTCQREAGISNDPWWPILSFSMKEGQQLTLKRDFVVMEAAMIKTIIAILQRG